MVQAIGMAKKKPKIDREQYRKPSRHVRVREVLLAEAEKAAEALAQDATQFVNDAVREKLERMGRWPVGERKEGAQ